MHQCNRMRGCLIRFHCIDSLATLVRILLKTRMHISVPNTNVTKFNSLPYSSTKRKSRRRISIYWVKRILFISWGRRMLMWGSNQWTVCRYKLVPSQAEKLLSIPKWRSPRSFQSLIAIRSRCEKVRWQVWRVSAVASKDNLAHSRIELRKLMLHCPFLITRRHIFTRSLSIISIKRWSKLRISEAASKSSLQTPIPTSI